MILKGHRAACKSSVSTDGLHANLSDAYAHKALTYMYVVFNLLNFMEGTPTHDTRTQTPN